MIMKCVKIGKLKRSSQKDDLKYWLGKTPDERIEAVETLRKQYHGNTQGLQRVYRVVQLSRS
jgi:hypothetical protein